MPSAIDPTQIPGKDIDPDAIESNASTIDTIGGSVRDNGSNVHLKWQGMAGVYEAPEAGTLLGLMQPVSAQATTAGDNLEAVAGALKRFAADVRPIKAELDSLRLQAEAFRGEIAGGVTVQQLNPAYLSTQGYYATAPAAGSSPYSVGGTTAPASDIPKYQTVTKEWHEVQEYVDRNNDLIGQVNAQQVALWDAERTCANTIRALFGGAPLHAYSSENDPLGYGLDEIPEGTEMPWGAPVERSEGCGEATAKFVFKDFLWEGLLVGGVWGTVEGLGTLVLGYNPATGDWFSGDAYGAAWGSLGLLVASGAMNSAILGPLLWADQGMESFGGGGFLPQEVRDFKAKADEAAVNTGKALIAWDKWADDPGTALGESVFNVGTILIPAGAAITGVKTAGTAASVLSKMARVVDLVDPASLAVNGAVRVGGLGLGSLDNLIGGLDLGAKLDPPHIEVYTATDAASAVKALDDWGVDLNTVTAHADNGIPVLEFPGGKIELPAGSFDNALSGVRGGDGAVDASVTAPVREPELVNAGGVRGETGASPVNSSVGEAPVRTETGGAGESTIVRDPETTTRGGGDTVDPNTTSGSGGSGEDSGSDASGGHGASEMQDDLDGVEGTRDETTGDSGWAEQGDGASANGASADGGDAGWTSSEGADLSLSATDRAAVDDYMAGSRSAEPTITADMQDVLSSHPGVRLEGLEYRLKSDESMYRKVATALDELPDGASSASVVSGIKDSVRYTYVVPDTAYTATVDGIMHDLVARGYEPTGRIKNSWGTDGYQGINTNWVDPSSGRIIEVQFHTDASLAAKMEAHGLYEQSRLPGLDADTGARLEAEQREIFGHVDAPAGASEIDWPARDEAAPSQPDTTSARGIDDQAFVTEVLDRHDTTAAEINDLRRVPATDLTPGQVDLLRELRDSVPDVSDGTPMSKVIALDDVENYIDGRYEQIGGFMTRAADYDGGARLLDEVVDELRLDYADSAFTRPDAEGFAVIDFVAGADAAFDVPYSERFGGAADWPEPFTGNGFTAARADVMVPEFVSRDRFLPPEGATISIVRDGVKTPVAVYTDGAFRRIGE